MTNIVYMKRFLLVFLLFAVLELGAQVAPDKYWIQFTDKKNTPYNIDKPEDFLSERSIQRRLDYDIAVDEYDLPVNPSYLKAVEDAGAVVLNPSKWLNGATVEITDNSVLSAVKSLPFVKKTRVLEDEPLKQMMKEKSLSLEKNASAVESAVRNHYGYAYNQIAQLNGVVLHDMGYRGEGMIIGVCDGGFTDADNHKVFESVRSEGRLLCTRDYLYKNGNVFTESVHGTSCWSLMAGNVPEEYVGTAPMASYVLCRTEDVNRESVIEEYNWVSAAEFLDSLGVDVISTSLGYIFFDDSKMDHKYDDLDGETAVITIGSGIAASRGIMCVVAAGNDGASDFPYISAPADGKKVMTVGAVGADGERAYFSSVGPTSDGRVKPDVMALGYGVSVASLWDSYYDGSGTSYACPVLAGMAACLWQANKDRTAAEIIETIKNNASNVSSPDSKYGYGLPDMMRAFESLSAYENVVGDVKNIISFFPNPSNGKVTVNLNVDCDVSVAIYDVYGKVLYYNDVCGESVSSLSSVMSSLKNGLYMVNVIGKEGSQTVKFIKY